VVALQALSAYSLKVTNTANDLNVNIKETEATHSFQVNDDNKLLTQEMKLSALPTPLDVEVNGIGCYLLQTVLR